MIYIYFILIWDLLCLTKICVSQLHDVNGGHKSRKSENADKICVYNLYKRVIYGKYCDVHELNALQIHVKTTGNANLI